MEYRVADLAEHAGLSIDTVRFYQSRGLLPPPERRGRTAVYGDRHLQILGRIRRLAAEGLTLKVVKRLLDSGADSVDRRLLMAIDDEVGSDRSMTRDELAADTGVPEALLLAAESSGLLQPVPDQDGVPRYTARDADTVRAGLRLLGFGFPLDELLDLAALHVRNVDEVTERAVDLFNNHVRRNETVESAEDVVSVFQEMLSAVTTLVALHFQRALVAKGRARLADGSDGIGDGLEAGHGPEALATAGTDHLVRRGGRS